MQKHPKESGIGATAHKIVALRRELAQAEKELRERAEREAVRLAVEERDQWRVAREDCLQLERIRRDASARLEAIRDGGQPRFPGEYELAQSAIRDVEKWELRDSAAYTIISFAGRRIRLRFLMGGAQREGAMRETISQGGVYTERGYFQEILK
ncbi:MAG: hypothetical protein WA715_27985 [Candidatus Acidiferrum sp.]